MSVFDRPPPDLGRDRAAALAREAFGVVAIASSLTSERDQNFLLETAEGDRFVLKIANPAEDRQVLEMENAAMEHLARRDLPFALPRPVPDRSGETILEIDGPGDDRLLVRMLTWVPGSTLKDLRPLPAGVLRAVGALLGAVDRELADFDHPAAHRDWAWDVRNVGFVQDNLERIDDAPGRRLIQGFLDRFAEQVLPLAPRLRSALIHNDGNDHNVVFRAGEHGPEISGLIDFGDMVHSWIACGLAVGIHYVVLESEEPREAGAEVVRGYAAEHPLREEEVAALFPLVCMRACASVTLAALRARRFPENAYLTVSEAPAWRFLRRMADADPGCYRAAFAAAAGAARGGG